MIQLSPAILRICVFICFVITQVLMQGSALAEGSKELTANGGNRAYLLSTTSTNPSYPYPTLGTMKVYVKAGEHIYLGSSAQGVGQGTMRLRAPDGSTYNSGASTTVGRLSTKAQELAGPLPNPGGYHPFIVPVSAGQEGVWEVDFISPTNGAESNGNPSPVAASVNWTQPFSQYIAAFDVSVRSADDSQFLTGRVFTNVLIGILGTFNVGFNAVLNIVTKDGYNYTLDNNGQAGNGFTFFANNKGFRNTDGTPSYKSVNSTTVGVNVYDPNLADTPSDITHKIFFNTPASDLPAAAPVPGGSNTWLVNAPVLPGIANVAFTGKDGKPGVSGTTMPGGKISFTATANGTYVINIDADQNGRYDDAADRQLTGTVTAGTNTVTWDGKDGTGAELQASAGSYSVTVSASLFAAEVHFPFFDVERNVNGIKLKRINGSGSPDNTIYWDDTGITTVGTASNPVKNLNGISSLTNGHKWGTTAPSANDDNDFGNNKSIDTWAYVIISAQGAGTDIMVQTPDASIISVPNIITPNNDGKNDVLEIKGIAGFPGSRLTIFNRWGNEVYRSLNYNNTWDGGNLSEGTYYYLLELKTSTPKPTIYKGWIYINRK